MRIVWSFRNIAVILPTKSNYRQFVRPVPDGYYEIISGHRRKHAAEKLGYRKVPVIIRVLSEDDSILSIDEDRRRNATLLEDSFYNRKNLNPQIHDTEFFADLETWQRKQRRRGTAVPGTDRISAKIEVKYVQISKKIIDERKTTWYVFLKKEIILKANLLKGRVAKPEGTKVRKFDHVSRLPLFPYHHNIWKRCLNRRDSDTFYTIQMCDFKKIQQGHWQILASVLFVCKNG